MKMSTLSKVEQRRRKTDSQIVSIGLWCELQNLLRQSLAGDDQSLIEFQQAIQYAPESMKMELLDQMNL